jgi:two-component system cell cycle response regulator DivK
MTTIVPPSTAAHNAEAFRPGGLQLSTTREAPLILIVDDVEDAREMCAEFLAHSRYRVATADDGLEALASARHLLPDVILMDLSMPWLDGLEATRHLKSDERTRNIPVIALTALSHGDVQKMALEAGCAAVVVKPYSPLALEEAIRHQLAGRAAEP